MAVLYIAEFTNNQIFAGTDPGYSMPPAVSQTVAIGGPKASAEPPANDNAGA